jgi:hypothetical protein
MRRVFFGILFGVLLSTMPAQGEIYVHTGFQMDWWESDAGDKGTQSHIPLEVGCNIDQFAFRLLTAQVYNRIEPDDGETRSIDGLVDTRVNMSYTIVDRLPVDLLVALDLNLPTGKTRLNALDAIAISNSDLVTITRMGEGLNINPSISVAKQWNRLLAAVGVGYIWRGEYDPTDDLRNYDPGNALNLNADVVYTFDTHWAGRLFGGYTDFEADQWQDHEYYEPGAAWFTGVSLNYTRARWQVGATVTSIRRAKEARLDYSGELETEASNSYGDEMRFEIGGGLQLTDRTDFNTTVRYLTVAANDYDPADFRNVSKETKSTLAFELLHRWSARWESGLRLSFFSLDFENNASDWDEENDYRGGTLALWAMARF